MKTLPDGSILLSAGEKITTGSYYVNPDNPLHYIPKYEPCSHRRFELKTLSCGKCTGIWKCDLLKTTTSVPECNRCKVPIDQRGISDTCET
jgi:hypothetical protein